MPPRLRIECPEWAGHQDPDDAGAWENDTPRSPLPPGPGSLPSSPSARKTKSRAARAYHRINSLKDAKVRAGVPASGATGAALNNHPPADSAGGCPVPPPSPLWSPFRWSGLPANAGGRSAAPRPSNWLLPTHRQPCAQNALERPGPPRAPPSPCPHLPFLPQVLVVTDMHRTESALDPALFQYHQHFESPWQLVGKTHLSEVRPLVQG